MWKAFSAGTVVLAVAACGSTDSGATVSASGGGGSVSVSTGSGATGTSGGTTVVPPPSPTPPDYFRNGIAATLDNSIASLMVVEDVVPNPIRTGRSRPPDNMTVTVEPGAIRIAAAGRTSSGAFAFGGTTLSRTGLETFGTATEAGDARVRTGTWTYAIDARYRSGAVRNNLVVAGGQVVDVPSSGSATYSSRIAGTIEQRFTRIGGGGGPVVRGATIPFSGTGNVNVDFATRSVSSTFTVGGASAAGTIGAGGQLAADGRITGTAQGNLTVTGYPVLPTGSIVGTIAGPNARETAGVVELDQGFGAGLTGSVVTAVTVNGAFLGADPSR